MREFDIPGACAVLVWGARTGIISRESYSVHSIEHVSGQLAYLSIMFMESFDRMDSMPASGR